MGRYLSGRDCEAEQNKEIRNRWFPEHRAEVFKLADATGKKEVTLIRWAKPGTSFYLVKYILSDSTLFVCGDVGDAVFQWSSLIDLDFLAGCNLDYFHEKCQASETGRDYADWDRDVCIDRALDRLRNTAKEKYGRESQWPRVLHEEMKPQDKYDKKLHEEILKKEFAARPPEEQYPNEEDEPDPFFVARRDHWWRPRTWWELWESADELKEAAGSKDEWREFLTAHGYEVFGDEFYEVNGEVVSMRCRAFLIGLKMAHQQLAAREKVA